MEEKKRLAMMTKCLRETGEKLDSMLGKRKNLDKKELKNVLTDYAFYERTKERYIYALWRRAHSCEG